MTCYGLEAIEILHQVLENQSDDLELSYHVMKNVWTLLRIKS